MIIVKRYSSFITHSNGGHYAPKCSEEYNLEVMNMHHNGIHVADWSAAFEENGSMKTGTVITIAALGALVLLVMAMVTVFFWQKHNLRPESPDSPKISRSSTNQLIADVAKGLAAHLDGPDPNAGCSPYHDCYEIPPNQIQATGRYLDLGGRSAGDGGSEEGNYSSLKAPEAETEPPYALIRQPDGRADEPCYSSLK